jgi:xylan 1,4-beta-xylosidase
MVVLASLLGLGTGAKLCGQTPADGAGGTTPPRIIDIDCSAVKGPRSMVYQHCVGAGRVGEGLRADWQAQLKTCKDAIGFQYLRCHGLLHDELGVYREDKQGNPIYNWQYIDMVYDYLLSIHVRPFVEIGFMPDALASIQLNDMHPPSGRRVSVFWWKANVSPPKSYDKWDALVKALVTHWTERYGADEVAQWYFEIWNEPNFPGFFSPVNEAARRDEYFELYAHTAKAVKSVNAAYRVGGPATTGPIWISELIAYCTANQVPLDFITYHAYGLGGPPGKVDATGRYIGGGLDEAGRKRLWLNRNLHVPARNATVSKAEIAKSSMPNLPVHITEWSASYSNHDPVHDSYFEAPYILEQLKHTETVASMSYWTFTDIFEESGPALTPFEGGFGLINLEGIKKPAFFAYSFLNQLGDKELIDQDNRSWATRDEAGGVQALFWDLTDLRGNDPADDWDFFRRVLVPKSKGLVTLRLRDLKPGPYHLSISRVGYEKNDAYTAYLKMGHPSQISPAQVAALEAQATGAPDEEREMTVDATGTWQGNFPIREDDVVLVKLRPSGGP